MSAVIQNEYTGNNSTTTYSFTFPYLKTSDIKASLDGVETTAFTLPNATTLQFNTAPQNGVSIKIFRETSVDDLTATFYAGSAIKSEDLNDNFTQNLYKTQEVGARSLNTLGGTMTGDLTLGTQADLVFEGATADAHETTIKVVDPTADRTITFPNVTGTVVTTGDTGTVATSMIATSAVTGIKIADDQINSEHYVDGSIDTAHIADAQVTTAKIADSNVTTGKLAADAVTAAKLADNAVVTANIVDDAVTTQKIAADSIVGSRIADNSIDSEHYVDGSIDNAHLASNSVTQAKMADDSVGTAELQDSSVDTARLADNSVTLAKMTDNSVGTSEIVDTAVTTAKIANNAITMAKLSSGTLPSDITVDSTNLVNGTVNTVDIADDAVTDAKLADHASNDSNRAVGANHIKTNSVTTEKISGTAVTDAKLASNAVTTSKITDANVTTVKIADSNVTLAKLASDLKQTSISDSDTQIPTSGAVVDYVAAQLAPIGGLEVIATEVAFPNTQPSAGVVISIADAGGIVVNGSGTSTTGRTVGGSTVTINNINSAFNSATVDAGVSFMVSSTGSGQVYNFHKATLKESDILNLSNDINDFGNRYRVNAGEPGSNNDEGDLVYDTNANKMKVYDGSSWGEVTSTGEFKYLFLCPAGGSGAPTINGSVATYDLREGSNSGSAASVTNAAQLIVSVNGVVQKANTGTSAPSEGFALVDSNTIVFGANLQTGDSVFIVQIGSAVTIPTPGDGTVTAAKITSSAVITDKIADDAVTNAKIASLAITNTELSGDIASNKLEVNDAHIIIGDANHDGALQTLSGDVTMTRTGAVTIANNAVTTTKIADNTIPESKLKVSNSPTNGYFLSAQSGNTGGMTWAEVDAGVTSDAQGNTVAGTGAGDDFSGTDAQNNSFFGKNAGTAVTTGDLNVAVGMESNVTGTTGSENTSVGAAALRYSGPSASHNTAIGRNSMHGAVSGGTGLITGNDNTAVGSNSLFTNTSGHSNAALGKNALNANEGGYNNVAIGHNALDANTSGSQLTAVGSNALGSNTSASFNTAVGQSSQAAITTGQYNNSLGYQTLYASTTGAHNLAIGYQTMHDLTNGSYNTAVGSHAMWEATNPTNNVALGYWALGDGVLTGSNNVAVGSEACMDMTSGYNNAVVGRRAMEYATTAGGNCVLGYEALRNAASNNNVAIGYGALRAYTATNGHNTFIGNSAGEHITGGYQNIAIGASSMGGSNATTAHINTMVGRATGNKLTTGNSNVGIGDQACYNLTTSYYNNALGTYALDECTTGHTNTAMGYASLSNLTTGAQNDAYGTFSGTGITTGHGNSLYGYFSGYYITTGDNNTCYGLYSGAYVNAITTGQYNVNLGNFSRPASASSVRCHAIGYNFGALAGNNTFSVQASSGSYQSNNSSSWSTTSDRRIKKGIVDNSVGLDAIEKIQVRNFEYKTQDEIVADNPELEEVIDSIGNKPKGQQLGVIAQEIEDILPDVVETQTTGVKTVNPDNLTWYLVNAVKELSAKVTALEAK